HSPKGRASLTREWLRQLAAAGVDPVTESAALRQGSFWRNWPAKLRNSWAHEDDFSHAVKDAMDGCLACKSCSGQCPIKVDVPSFRSKFLELYYGRYWRRPRYYMVGRLEGMLPTLGKIGGLYNVLLDNPLGRAAMRWIRLGDTPHLSPISYPDS